jgi:flagellar protein FlaJ
MKPSNYTNFCRKTFGWLIEKQSERELQEKELTLEEAFIEMDYDEYYSFALMNTLISIFIGFLFSSIIYLIIPNTITTYLLFIIPTLSAIIVAVIFFNYPDYLVKKRAESIDKFLPYSINFISSMAVAGISPSDIFQTLSTVEVYGEIQRESKRIAKEIKIMGVDNITALKNAIEFTPSRKFKAFLQGVIGTIQSGSDLHTYLENVSEKYLQDDLIERKKHLEMLSVVAESFVIGVIAFPIFLVIILSIMGFFGGSMTVSTQILYLFSFLVLPFVYLAFYLMIRTTTAEQVSRFVSEKKLDFSDFYNDYKKEIYFQIFAVISIIFFTLFIYILSTTDQIYSGKYLYYDFVFIAIILLFGPLSFYVFARYKIKKDMQERLPEFLTEVSDSLNSGMTTFEAIKVAEKGRYGHLNSEIKRMKTQLSWNVSVKDVFQDFSDRVKSGIIQRIVVTIKEGLLMGGSTSKIFKAAAKEVNQINQIEHQRKANMSIYMSVIIMCFFIFLAIILILDKTIFARFFELQDLQIQNIGNAFQISSIKPLELKYALFSFIYVQSLGSGILAGFMMDGKLSSGLRYGCVLALVSFIIFKLLL